MHLISILPMQYRSGTEEKYSELQQLLHDIHAYRRDRVELENKEKNGQQMRAAALVGMASEIVFSFKCLSVTKRIPFGKICIIVFGRTASVLMRITG